MLRNYVLEILGSSEEKTKLMSLNTLLYSLKSKGVEIERRELKGYLRAMIENNEVREHVYQNTFVYSIVEGKISNVERTTRDTILYLYDHDIEGFINALNSMREGKLASAVFENRENGFSLVIRRQQNVVINDSKKIEKLRFEHKLVGGQD